MPTRYRFMPQLTKMASIHAILPFARSTDAFIRLRCVVAWQLSFRSAKGGFTFLANRGGEKRGNSVRVCYDGCERTTATCWCSWDAAGC